METIAATRLVTSGPGPLPGILPAGRGFPRGKEGAGSRRQGAGANSPIAHWGLRIQRRWLRADAGGQMCKTNPIRPGRTWGARTGVSGQEGPPCRPLTSHFKPQTAHFSTDIVQNKAKLDAHDKSRSQPNRPLISAQKRRPEPDLATFVVGIKLRQDGIYGQRFTQKSILQDKPNSSQAARRGKSLV
jgi:hypothetical protein